MSENILSRNVSDELRNAMNLIADYCKNQLPDGWLIELAITSDDVSCELSDPFGDVHPDWGSGGERNVIVDCCDYALHTSFE